MDQSTLQPKPSTSDDVHPASFHFFARVLKDAFRAQRIEYAAGAEPSHIGDCLIGSAAAFFPPVDHFLGEAGRDHAVAAHRSQLEQLSIRQLFDRTLESQRVSDAVAGDTGELATLLGALDRSRDVDRQA